MLYSKLTLELDKFRLLFVFVQMSLSFPSPSKIYRNCIYMLCLFHTNTHFLCILQIKIHHIQTNVICQTYIYYAKKIGIVTINQCIARQLNLIEEHATRVRPIELGRSFGNIEIWVAPGDTEFQMSQNDPNIVLTKMARYVDGCENIPNDQVGFVAEVVTNHGEGFRVVRNGKDGTVPPYLIGEG
mmetsp:Transcript_42017/g.63417  ORF Transcript_42017/g.63417 Transcript_42017/m.63417 type:complete len:185 (+) Transcript_42017:155-709(+)